MAAACQWQWRIAAASDSSSSEEPSALVLGGPGAPSYVGETNPRYASWTIDVPVLAPHNLEPPKTLAFK